MAGQSRLVNRSVHLLVAMAVLLGSVPMAAPGPIVRAAPHYSDDAPIYPDDGSFFLFRTWPQTSLYSGAATYSYPIEVPPGRNGMAPALSLAYSSRSVDGLLGVVQSPSVGLGWSIGGEMKIVQETATGKHSDGVMRWKYKDRFTLMMGSASYQLIEGSVLTSGGLRYYTQERSGLLVMRYNRKHGYPGYPGPIIDDAAYAALPSGIKPTNESSDYWVVTTPGGAEYRFGFKVNSEQMVPMESYNWNASCCNDRHRFPEYSCPEGPAYAGHVYGAIPMAYRLDRVEDVHGNVMTYQYTEERRVDAPNTPDYDRAVYLQRVEYPGDYRVDFILESRGGHDDGPAPQHVRDYSLWEGKRVRSIRVCVGPCSGDNIVREYVLDYETPTLEWPGYDWVHHEYPPEVTLLRAVHQYGRGGEAGGSVLPVMTLSYVVKSQADKVLDPKDGGSEGGKLQYHRLSRLDNGYGGWVEFSYGRVMSNHVYSYRVTERRQWDGLGHKARIGYNYGGACFAGTNSRCRRDEAKNDALLGHDWTEETYYDYGSVVLSRAKHYFHNDKEENRAVGREYRSEAKAPSGTVMQMAESTWAVEEDCSGIEGRYCIGLADGESCQDGACTRTAYSHDEWGNVTAEYHYGAEERILNPGFEKGDEGWSFWQMSAPPAGATTESAFVGRRGMKLDASGFSHGAVYQEIEGLVPGETYVVRVWVRAPESTTADFDLRLHDSTQWINERVVPTVSWSQVSVGFTAKEAGTVKIDLHYWDGSGAIYVDEVSLARADDSDDERTIQREYFNLTDALTDPDDGRWLIGLKWREEVRGGIPGDERETETHWYYDDQNHVLPWEQSDYISKGLVTMVGSGLLSPPLPPGPLPDPPLPPYATTRYAYDEWGNLTDTWDPLGSQTTTTYDTTYHQFPVQVCNELGHCSTVEYYGVNQSAECIADGYHFGAVCRSYGPNGPDTAILYAYDPFGRTTKIVRPDDSPGKPTVEYRYDLVTDVVLSDNFEASCSAYQLPEGWKKWNLSATCFSGEAYDGAWRVNLHGPKDQGGSDGPGAFYRASKVGLEPHAAYRVRIALKGNKGTVRANVDTDEGWRTAFTANASGSWRIVEGMFVTGANPGEGKLHIWGQPPKNSVHADVDQVEVARARGLRVTTIRREKSGLDGTLMSYTYYDGLGRAIQSRAEAEDGQWAVSSTEYDALGRPVRGYVPRFEGGSGYTAPDGLYTLTEYDALGRVVRMVNPDGTAAGTVYGSRTATQMDANGQFRFSDQDGLGQMVRVWEVQETWQDRFDTLDGSKWHTTVQVLDGGTVRTTGTGGDYSATFYRNEQTINSAEGIRVEFKLDSTSAEAILALDTDPYYPDPSYRRWGLWAVSGLLRAHWCEGSNCFYESLGNIRANVWHVLWLQVNDEDGYRLQVWERDNPAASASYSRKAPNFSGGKQWRFRHWVRSGTSWVDNYAEAEYYKTEYAYDVLGNLTQVTDAKGNITTVEYDALSRKTGMDDPDMGHWAYDYDDAGNLKVQTDARGCVTNFAYDPLSRLTGKTYGGACAGAPAVSYTYDQGDNGAGRRTGMSDGSGSAAWSYDARGRMTREDKTINGAGTFTTQYTYDAMDRVVDMAYPDGEVVHHDYNSAGALESLAGSDVYAQDASYNAMGQMTALPLGNGLTTGYTYHDLNYRLQRIEIPGLLDLAYTYDNVGNVLSITDGMNGNQAQRFTYDALDRLTHAWTTGGGEGEYDRTYTYDPIGNIVSRVNDYLGTMDYHYDGSGHTHSQPHAVISVSVGLNTWSYIYDANGNMTSRTENGVQYTQAFNAENKLETVTNTGTDETTTILYDGDGNRVLRVNPDGSKTAYVGGYFEVDFTGPDAPGDLAATPLSRSKVQLAWTDNSDNEDEFRVERSPDGTGGWVEIAAVGADATSYSDGGLACETSYFYRVRAYNAVGYSGYSNTAAATTLACPTPPSAPGDLMATPLSRSQIGLTWTDNSGDEDGFKVERSPGGAGGWVEVGTVGADATSYSDDGLGCGTSYSYRVRSYNAVGYSGYSNTAAATTLACPTPPNAPGDLVATPLSRSEVRLAWTDNSDDEDGFKLERSPDGAGGWVEIATMGAGATSYSDDGLACETSYSYRVRAHNAGGCSGYSNTAAATTLTCPTLPNAPGDLVATPLSRSEVRLTWTDNSNDEDGFKIERSFKKTVWSEIATVGANVTSYTDPVCELPDSRSGLAFSADAVGESVLRLPEPMVVYYYRVRAYNAAGYSGYSNVSQCATEPCLGPLLSVDEPGGRTYSRRVEPRLLPEVPAGFRDAGAANPVGERVASATAQASTPATPPNGQTWRSYYTFGSQRVAMRKSEGTSTTLIYLHGDHLGSTSLATNATGGEVPNSRATYYPYGEMRTGSAQDLPTDYQYTGQRHEMGFGLYDYNARYYDPALGRFVSADTIVPNPANPQDLNRYAYTRNSPLNSTDPSGHVLEPGTGGGGIGTTLQIWLLANYYGRHFDELVSFGVFERAYHGACEYAEIQASNSDGVVNPVDYNHYVFLGMTNYIADESGVDYHAVSYMTSDMVYNQNLGPDMMAHLISIDLGALAAVLAEGTAYHMMEFWQSGGPVSSVPDNVKAWNDNRNPHGNSLASMKPQHGYEIYEKSSGDVVKTGVSGQPLNKNGSSPRANRQVNALNVAEGFDKYGARVVKTNMPGRAAALEWERNNASRLHAQGNSMVLHHRPRSW